MQRLDRKLAAWHAATLPTSCAITPASYTSSADARITPEFHVKEPARQGESIDRFRIDYLDGEWNLRIQIAPDVGWSVEQQRYYRARHAL